MSTPNVDRLTAQVKRGRERADRLPRRKYEAEGVLLELHEREQRLASLRGGRAQRLADGVAPNGGGPQGGA